MNEASGVVYRDGSFWIVGNEADGCVYRLDAPDAAGPDVTRLREVDPADLERIDLPAGGRASDLESIDFMPDGRVFVLSEDHRTLFGDSREEITFTNHHWAMETDGAGMEGLAIREDGTIAVLWEGRPTRGNPTPPCIVVRSPGRVFGDTVIELDRTLLNGLMDERKVRAADLVWTAIGATPGFIVLVHCEAKDREQHKWLVRIDQTGRGQGEAIALRDLFDEAGLEKSKKLASRNWEGLGWVTRQRRLCMVDDSDGAPYLAVIDLPPTWPTPGDEAP